MTKQQTTQKPSYKQMSNIGCDGEMYCIIVKETETEYSQMYKVNKDRSRFEIHTFGTEGKESFTKSKDTKNFEQYRAVFIARLAMDALDTNPQDFLSRLEAKNFIKKFCQ